LRRFKKILRNNPSSECIEFAKLIVMNLFQVQEQIKDKHVKDAIQSIKRGTFHPTNNHVALRIDSIQEDHEIGMVSAMGTTATISRRIIAASHYVNIQTISEMIFVCHSQQNVWQMENHSKVRKGGRTSNGNRANSEALLSLLEEIKESFSIPYIVIEIIDNEAEQQYMAHFS